MIAPNSTRFPWAAPALVALLLLAACRPIEPPAPAAPATDTPAPAAEGASPDGVETSAGAPPVVSVGPGSSLPLVTEYNLGETLLEETHQPVDSRFRNMPVRLNGVIGVPQGGGPAPVALILHGTHPGCPETRHMVDEWPCAPEVEQRNYLGLAWLAQRLAEAGYVAIVPNINAEYTFGWGEPPEGQRLLQLADAHLSALAAASAGADGANDPDFGVDLAGRADLSNLLLIGHSRGAGESMRLLRARGLEAPTADALPAGQTYGPARGLLAVAPAVTWLDSDALDVPLVVVLAACDGDLQRNDGQTYFENLRLAPGQQAWASSLWLERANHNGFNAILPAEGMTMAEGNPACATRLDADAQRAFLGDAAVALATALFSDDPAAAAQARAALGLNLAAPLPAEHFGAATRAAVLAPAAARRPLLTPTDAAELERNAQGGPVVAEGVTLTFCPPGFSTPAMIPGTELCRRPNFAVPGNPAMVVVDWDAPGAALRFVLPDGADLSADAALSLRVAVDPLSLRNTPGAPQGFSLALTDGAGATAVLPAPADDPALAFPAGTVSADQFFVPGIFSAVVPLTTIRVPLGAFAGVDLADVREVAMRFDQTDQGTLFLADLEVLGGAGGE